MGINTFEIVWTDKSVFELRQIYQFLFLKSPDAARSQIDKIVRKVSLLEKGFSKIGQREPLLKDHPGEFRYLVSGNYKIIYSHSSEQIYIHTIFDTRQNPKKLREKK